MLFTLVNLWCLLALVSASPSLFPKEHLVINPGNITLNQYCFIFLQSAISYDNTSISLVNVNDNGTSEVVMKYANDEAAERTIVELSLDKGRYFTDRSYNPGIDYCANGTLNSWLRLVDKALTGRLKFVRPGPGVSCRRHLTQNSEDNINGDAETVPLGNNGELSGNCTDPINFETENGEYKFVAVHESVGS